MSSLPDDYYIEEYRDIIMEAEANAEVLKQLGDKPITQEMLDQFYESFDIDDSIE